MKPILFNTEMVKAILEGRKTVTRRVMKPQPVDTEYCNHEMVTFNDMLPGYYDGDYTCACRKCGYGVCMSGESVFKPPYVPGDILYVRETWCDPSGTGYPILYKADMPMRFDAENTEIGTPIDLRAEDYKWRPSIHMPKEAARLFRKVTNVRVERLQDITPEQARAEGCDGRCNCPSSGSSGSLSCVIRDFSVEKFETVWDSTIKPADLDKYGWNANPWVWVIEFERCEKQKEEI